MQRLRRALPGMQPAEADWGRILMNDNEDDANTCGSCGERLEDCDEGK